MSDETNKQWQSRVQADLASFSDPGTSVDWTDSNKQALAEWSIRGIKHSATITYSLAYGLNIQHNGIDKKYRGFLSEIADLKYIAQMIQQSAKPTDYIDVQASLDTDTNKSSAIELLTGLVKEDDLDQTRVIMLRGDAGSGKTEILKELVRRQANQYLQGQADKLLIYVNAQGRSLARLDEALAIALQDLRSGVTYHAIPSLTRWNLVVPVIDGFDELLGVAGYEDAFSSLAEFLEQLRGEGQLIASARSVYYEEEFLNRADKFAHLRQQAWSHRSIKVEPWNDNNRMDYLDRLAKEEGFTQLEIANLRTEVEMVFTGNNEFAGKPLFFTRTVGLILRNPDQIFGDDLLTTLVDGFLEREQQEKLLDKQGRPLLDKNQLLRLLREVAHEMWTVQTRELNSDVIREVALLILDDMDLPSDAQAVVVERAPTLAFLTQSNDRRGITFEHESFFFDFLAQTIVHDYLDAGTNLRVMLGTSALPDDVADRTGLHLLKMERLNSNTDLSSLLRQIGEAGAVKWFREVQVRENAGRLVNGIIAQYSANSSQKIQVQNLYSLTFPGGDLHEVCFEDCEFRDIVFRRTDLTSTRFLNCKVKNVIFTEPRIAAGSTRLDLIGINPSSDFRGVRTADSGSLIYDPVKINELLAKCGISIPIVESSTSRYPAPAFRELMERLMRAYQRANPICTADETLSNLFNDNDWPSLQAALVRHGIVKEETRGTGGKNKQFLRRQYLPEQIMAGIGGRQDIESHIANFWNDLPRNSS